MVDDYYKRLVDLETENDVLIATKTAHGLGIADEDIFLIEDWPMEKIEDTINSIKRDAKFHGKEGKNSFVFVYCVGHGACNEFLAHRNHHF